MHAQHNTCYNLQLESTVSSQLTSPTKLLQARSRQRPAVVAEIQQAQRCTGQSQKKRRAYSKYDKDDDWAVEGQEDNDDEDEGDEDAGDDGDGDNLASDSGDDEEIDINAILESGHEGTLPVAAGTSCMRCVHCGAHTSHGSAIGTSWLHRQS